MKHHHLFMPLKKWPIAKYRFEFIVKQAIRFSKYSGGAIREAFGNALKKAACMTKQDNCFSCPLHNTCPYTTLFETSVPVGEQGQKFSSIPGPYVIEAVFDGKKEYLENEVLSFEMVLFGNSRNQLALIIFALQNAFARAIGHGTAILNSVFLVSEDNSLIEIYGNNYDHVAEHNNVFNLDNVRLNNENNDIYLDFITPLRLQENGRILNPDQIDVYRLFKAIIRKLSLLMKFHANTDLELSFDEIGCLLASVGCCVDMHWKNWYSYSNKQKQIMNLGGFIGTVKLSNVPLVIKQYFTLGSLCHVGKNTTFGLGKYIIRQD